MNNKFSLLNRKEYPLTDNLIVHIPLVSEIRSSYQDELEYYKLVSVFIKTPCDAMVELDDIEKMEQADENRFYLYLNKESEIINKQASKIVEFARRTLFLTDTETNWQACIWYMDRFQFDKSRINASSPVKSLSFINIHEKENRWYLQLYAKYLVGISDLSLSNIRNKISFISQFLQYLDGRSKKVTMSNENYISERQRQDNTL